MAFGESINTDVLHDETFDLLCSMCEQKGRNREAEKYCEECGDYSCLSCVKVHAEVPSLKRHKILDKGKFPSRSITARSSSGKTQPMAQTERCDRHPHHYIDMYCENHDDVGCGNCIMIDHSLCPNIFLIAEILQSNTRISPAKILKKLKSKSKYHNVSSTQQEALLKVKGRKEYCVGDQSELCNLVSACTLEDGTILLSDFTNNKLKRLDSSTYTVIDYCDLPGRPWQVCSINKHQAAVCLPHLQEVHFISVSNRMTLTNKITTDFYCYGLAYANGNLYISDYSTSVYIYSVSARKLKQFSKDQPGQEQFHYIRSLTVSEDSSRIYVACFNNGLIILDNHGKVVGKFNGQQLNGAYDSYLTGRGSLLVCGKTSNNVLQLGLDGELIGEVVKIYDKDAGHQAICCNQQMSRMIIGRGVNEIEVYDLKYSKR